MATITDLTYDAAELREQDMLDRRDEFLKKFGSNSSYYHDEEAIGMEYVEKEAFNPKVKLRVTALTLENIIRLAMVTDELIITYADLLKIRDVLNIQMDVQDIAASELLKNRIYVLNKVLEARLENDIKDQTVLQGIALEWSGQMAINVTPLDRASANEIKRTIERILMQAGISDQIGRLTSSIEPMYSIDPREADKAREEFVDVIKTIDSIIDENTTSEVTEPPFKLSAATTLDTINAHVLNPDSEAGGLRLQMHGVNQIIGGKLENKRVYTLVGPSGEGKSLTMVDFALQIKDANKDIDTSRGVPTIVLLVMENSVSESVIRMMSIASRGKFNTLMRDRIEAGQVTPEEVADFMKRDCGFMSTPSSPIDIRIEYRAGMSCTTAVYDEITREVERDGGRVIILMQDYVRRIKCPIKELNGDVRERLGEVINEDKKYANRQAVPVVTGCQVNRVGIEKISVFREKGLHGAVDLLDKDNIADSTLIYENSDVVIMICPEKDNNGRFTHMGFKNVKSRVEIPFNTVYQPYYENTSTLVRDTVDEPAYVRSMQQASNPPSGKGALSPLSDDLEKDESLPGAVKDKKTGGSIVGIVCGGNGKSPRSGKGKKSISKGGAEEFFDEDVDLVQNGTKNYPLTLGVSMHNTQMQDVVQFHPIRHEQPEKPMVDVVRFRTMAQAAA